MKRIKLKNLNNDNNYFLLESRELQDGEISDLLKSYLDKDEVIKIIDEGGIHSTANQYLVLERDSNNNFIKTISFDDDTDFIYLE